MSNVIYTCPHNKSVTCGWQECESCGWNPEVDAKRREKTRERATVALKKRKKWLIGSGAYPHRKKS